MRDFAIGNGCFYFIRNPNCTVLPRCVIVNAHERVIFLSSIAFLLYGFDGG